MLASVKKFIIASIDYHHGDVDSKTTSNYDWLYFVIARNLTEQEIDDLKPRIDRVLEEKDNTWLQFQQTVVWQSRKVKKEIAKNADVKPYYYARVRDYMAELASRSKEIDFKNHTYHLDYYNPDHHYTIKISRAHTVAHVRIYFNGYNDQKSKVKVEISLKPLMSDQGYLANQKHVVTYRFMPKEMYKFYEHMLILLMIDAPASEFWLIRDIKVVNKIIKLMIEFDKKVDYLTSEVVKKDLDLGAVWKKRLGDLGLSTGYNYHEHEEDYYLPEKGVANDFYLHWFDCDGVHMRSERFHWDQEVGHYTMKPVVNVGENQLEKAYESMLPLEDRELDFWDL